MKSVMVGCHKGGVSKTQTALELAVFLAMKGKTLVIDADPQANCSSILSKGTDGTGRMLSEILIARNGIKDSDIMTRVFANGAKIDYVMSDITSSRIEARIVGESPKEYIMSDAIAGIRNRYDYIVIDTAPSAELLSLSSMICCDSLLVVTCADKSSVEGAKSILEVAERVRSNARLNPGLKICGLILTRYRFTISTRLHLAAIRSDFEEIYVDPPISECIKVQEAVNNGLPVLVYDPSCKAACDYKKAFDTIFSELKK